LSAFGGLTVRKGQFPFFAALVSLIFILLIVLAPFAFSALLDKKFIHVNGAYSSDRNAPNIITNGDLETLQIPGTIGNWQVITSDSIHSGVLSRTTDAHSGSYSGLFTITANPNTGGFVALSESTLYWAIGKTYDLTFYYKSSLSSCYASIFCKSEQTTKGFDIAYWSSANLQSTNTWTKVTVTFGPVPEGTQDIQIHFGPPEGVTGTFQVDNISTQFTNTQPTTTPPTPTPPPTPIAPTPTQSPPTSTPFPTLTYAPPTPTYTPPSPTPPTPTPTQSTNPSQVSPEPTSTSNPSLQPTAQYSPTPTPMIPELSVGGVVFIVIIVASLALSIWKCSKAIRRRRFVQFISMFIAILLLAVMANIAYGPNITADSAPNDTVAFSLWFTNGTAIPTDGRNVEGYQNGGMYLNIGGISCIPSGYGSSRAMLTNVVVLRNDGNVPINIALALTSIVKPSNIEIFETWYPMSSSANQPYSNSWMGIGNLAEGNPVAPGKCLWMGITITLAQPNVPASGTPNYDFNYSFNIEVTATPA
jgi:hypothetical protein